MGGRRRWFARSLSRGAARGARSGALRFGLRERCRGPDSRKTRSEKIDACNPKLAGLCAPAVKQDNATGARAKKGKSRFRNRTGGHHQADRTASARLSFLIIPANDHVGRSIRVVLENRRRSSHRTDPKGTLAQVRHTRSSKKRRIIVHSPRDHRDGGPALCGGPLRAGLPGRSGKPDHGSEETQRSKADGW